MPISATLTLPTAKLLDRAAITRRAHAAARGAILARGDTAVPCRSYASYFGGALKLAWNAAYEAAEREGRVDRAVVSKRRSRQEAAARRRTATSPLARALNRIAEQHQARVTALLGADVAELQVAA